MGLSQKLLWSGVWGPFHKSLYERVLLYVFVEPVLNYRSKEFVALTNLYETGPWSFDLRYLFSMPVFVLFLHLLCSVIVICHFNIYLTEADVMHEEVYVYSIWSNKYPFGYFTSVCFIIFEVLLAIAHGFLPS